MHTNAQNTAVEEKISALLQQAQTIRINNLPQSIQLAEEALHISKEAALPHLTAKSLSQLSFYQMIVGEFITAISNANEAIELFTRLKDERGMAEVKYTIASVHYKTDNMYLGLQYILDCLTIYSRYQDHTNMAKAYKVLGTIYEFFGDIENAIESYESSVEAARTVGDINMKTNAYNPLSGLYLNRNNIAKAREIIERSITLKQQSGDVRGLAFAYYGRAKIFTKTGDFENAEKDFKEAIDIHIKMGEKLGLAMALHKLGVLYIEWNKPDLAEEKLLEALELARKYNIRLLNTKINYLLYGISKNQHREDKALSYLEAYLAEQSLIVQNQTQQIVKSYKLIQEMNAQSFHDQMLKEKEEMEAKQLKAEMAAKAKQDFLSNMSHEIRTPLNAVITITGLLQERSNPEDQKLLESLQFASNNLLLLINDILDFSKLEDGKMQLEMKPAHLSNLISNIINTYESMAREKGLLLRHEIDAAVAKGYELDEAKLSQILNNLLGNAIKFTSAGTIDLIIRKKEENENGHLLHFEVKDTGKGIPTDFLEEIFDKFTQPKSVTTKEQSGSGLGLSIVKKLVEMHGSDIKIHTEVGKGSSFMFDMLLKPVEIIAKPVIKSNYQFNNMKLLMAEDNKINVLVATKLLAKWGIVADCAANGAEAFAKAKAIQYDVILMDIHMPEMNGYDAAAAIRQQENKNKQTPIYALTADITAEAGNPAVEYFNGFLRKPIEIDQLFSVLSEIDQQLVDES